jgi:hypothetical protein
MLPLPAPPVAEAVEETRVGMMRMETKAAMIGQQQEAIDTTCFSFVAA